MALDNLLLTRLPQSVFRLSVLPWPLALAHVPLT